MADSIWTAVSGAAAQAQAVDIIANNLANADTPAFKKDVPTFREYLAAIEREKDAPDVPRGQIKDKDFYPLDGRDKAMVIMDGTHTGFQQGHLRVTNSPLDIALQGPGFLEVNTPQGIRYTRSGSLRMAADGRLVTAEGQGVLSDRPLGLTGDTTQVNNTGARFINLRDVIGPISITEKGEVFAGGDLIAQISVVEFQDLKKVQKTGGGLFEASEGANPSLGIQTSVKQGMLETSNVNPVEEMTNLIKANRMFEHSMKVMKTYAELPGSDIGKL